MSASKPLFGPMGPATALEQKLKWMTFPGLIRGIAIIHFFVYLLLVLQWDSIHAFDFNPEKIQEGEYWRIFSFLAIPPILGMGVLGALFMFFLMKICFLVNDSLEHRWGAFRTTMYVYATIACLILANFVVGPIYPYLGGRTWGTTMFIAFATLFPRVEFRLFFILPIQVWVIGCLFGLVTIISCIGDRHVALYNAIALFPYLIWAIPHFRRVLRDHRAKTTHKSSFKARSLQSRDAFHKCDECGATDATHPERDFRVTENDQEICNSCLDKKPGGDEPAQQPS